MKNLLKLISSFEERNNISITVICHSDGSGMVEEFWDRECLTIFDSLDDLEIFLKETDYELDENGRSYSPVRVKDKDETK